MIVDDLVTPAALTGYVREVPYPAQFILNRFLPDRTFQDIEAAFDEVTRTNRTAKFRSWDAETPIGKRDTVSRKRVALPPIGEKTVVTEYERIKLEMLRTGGTRMDAVIDQIYDDGDLNTRVVQNRVELARGDVLEDGIVTIAENGLFTEADYGVDPSHFVNPTLAWDHDDAVPLRDLLSWMRLWAPDGVERGGYMIMSDARISDLLLNESVRNLATSQGITPDFIDEEALNRLLRRNRLPQLVPYDSRVDVDGVSTPILNEDLVMFVPANAEDLGFTAWGITAEALELAGGDNPSLEFEEAPGLVGVVMKEGDPVRTWTKVTGVSLPVITNPRKLAVADVSVGTESS